MSSLSVDSPQMVAQQVKLLGAQWQTIGADQYLVHGEFDSHPGAFAATRPDLPSVYVVSLTGGGVQPYNWHARNPWHTSPKRLITASELATAIAYAYMARGGRLTELAREATGSHVVSGLSDAGQLQEQLARMIATDRPDDQDAQVMAADLRRPRSESQLVAVERAALGVSLLASTWLETYREARLRVQ
jgi:hypothetical protein